MQTRPVAILLLTTLASLLAACGKEEARAVVDRWHCISRNCTVEFIVRNPASSPQVIRYTVRARTGSGSSQQVVGEKAGQVELNAGEARPVAESVPTTSRPDHIIVSLADN
jgi:hypothetical protein